MMRDEQHQFLARFGRPPARLTAAQTAWSQLPPHDIPVLVGTRLLKPLGNPPANGIKFFATSDVLDLIQDRAWLTKVTATIYAHWHRQNAKRKNGESSVSQVIGPVPA